ncbi:hypothetical protein [Runella sp.]|uniref:hypothetical protein n=1 Tax=Runella sp. TaxID=1960881 RepID=UPI003018B96E
MAKSLNIVIGADIEKLREGFNKAISVVQSSGNKMSAEVAKSAKAMEERLAAIATRNPTMGSVRQLTQLAMEARALGPEFAQVANEIIKQAGRMKDAIGDTRAEVAYFGSDTRRLDAVLGGVQAVAGAFSAVQGAAALFGAENEDLQKTMVKLQGAIALVNGVQAVSNILLDENATKTGILALANNVYTAATAGATAATIAFRVALMSIGIGVAIAGIAALAANYQKLKDALFPADKALRDFNATLDKGIAKNENEIKVLEAKGNTLGALALKEENLYKTLAKARANIGKNNKENWGKIIDDTKAALTVLGIERDKYNQSEQEKAQTRADEGQKEWQQETEKQYKAQQERNKKLLDAAIQGINDRYKGEKDAEQFMIDRNKKLRDKAVADKLKSKEFNPANMIAGTGVQPILLQVKIDPSSYSESVQKMKKLTEELNAAFATLQTEAAASFAQLIADVATGDKNAGKNFGKNMLGAIAGFMDTLGKAIVATAIATDAFEKLIIANPIAAAAAGIALMAGAAIVRNTLAKGPEVTAFADGGIVSGPTLGLMGEYPGASSNPEVIAPLDKLKGMLNTNNDNSGYIASTTIQGRDLAIVLERYNRDSKRG